MNCPCIWITSKTTENSSNVAKFCLSLGRRKANIYEVKNNNRANNKLHSLEVEYKINSNYEIKTTSGRLPESQLVIDAGRLWWIGKIIYCNTDTRTKKTKEKEKEWRCEGLWEGSYIASCRCHILSFIYASAAARGRGCVYVFQRCFVFFRPPR